jgi:hypothetical protein
MTKKEESLVIEADGTHVRHGTRTTTRPATGRPGGRGSPLALATVESNDIADQGADDEPSGRGGESS